MSDKESKLNALNAPGTEPTPYEAMIALLCNEVEADPVKQQSLRGRVSDIFSDYMVEEAVKAEPSRPSGPGM